MFIGILLGTAIYMLLFSNYIIKINVKIITFTKAILKKVFNVILFPFSFVRKTLKKFLFKPINIFIINIRKFSTKFFTKNHNITSKTKKLVKN